MIRTTISTFLFVMASLAGISQHGQIDSTRRKLNIAKDDTSRVLIMSDLSFDYGFRNTDSSALYADRALELATQVHFSRGEVRALISKASIIETKGELPEALNLAFTALDKARKQNLLLETSMCLTLIANIFYDLNDFAQAITFYNQATSMNEALKGEPAAHYWIYQNEVNLGTTFMLSNQLDSAFTHLQKAYSETIHDDVWHPVFLMFFGRLLFLIGKHETGIDYLRQSVQIFEEHKEPYSTSDAYRILASCLNEINQHDSAIYYAKKALEKAQSIGYETSIFLASKQLAEEYEPANIKEALYYRKVFDTANDILYGPQKVKSLQKTLSDEQDRQRKAEAERIAFQNRLKQYGLLAGLGVVLLLAFIFYRNNLQRKRANTILESTLANLRATQSQLVQSEKMASLGELTAGIAHEIQNPLNFVNNFSEVNTELISELRAELETGNRQQATAIADNIKENEEKIIFHGKRAGAIVKSMLQHSRAGSGKKELTDLNALVDEYVRLAYHGFRAKDKSFNVTLKTEYDESIGKINIVPQDIGRVILNLITNAFYAAPLPPKGGDENFQPTVIVTTRLFIPPLGPRGAEISVGDNGPGIPEKIRDKIFQPFFTTKPTGEGTGLGLSLSYDIIKAHGGEINVRTREGEGTTFVIQLPG